MSESVPAGWYPDPQGDGLRYWDGSSWTEQQARAPDAQGAPPPPPPQPLIRDDDHPAEIPPPARWRLAVGFAGVLLLLAAAAVLGTQPLASDCVGPRAGQPIDCDSPIAISREQFERVEGRAAANDTTSSYYLGGGLGLLGLIAIAIGFGPTVTRFLRGGPSPLTGRRAIGNGPSFLAAGVSVVLIIVACLGTWATALGVSASGVEYTEGIVVLVGALVAAGMLWGIAEGYRRLTLAVAFLGLGALGVGIYEFTAITDANNVVNSLAEVFEVEPSSDALSTGWGVYVLTAAGFALAVAGVKLRLELHD